MCRLSLPHQVESFRRGAARNGPASRRGLRSAQNRACHAEPALRKLLVPTNLPLYPGSSSNRRPGFGARGGIRGVIRGRVLPLSKDRQNEAKTLRQLSFQIDSSWRGSSRISLGALESELKVKV